MGLVLDPDVCQSGQIVVILLAHSPGVVPLDEGSELWCVLEVLEELHHG